MDDGKAEWKRQRQLIIEQTREEVEAMLATFGRSHPTPENLAAVQASLAEHRALMATLAEELAAYARKREKVRAGTAQ